MPAFQNDGSVLLLRIALDMLYAKSTPAQETSEDVDAATAKEDIAITPLGVPMLAGPGAISTVLILMSQARGWQQRVALFGCVAVVTLASYIILRVAVLGARRLSPLALKLVTRLMGLLLAAVSV